MFDLMALSRSTCDFNKYLLSNYCRDQREEKEAAKDEGVGQPQESLSNQINSLKTDKSTSS